MSRCAKNSFYLGPQQKLSFAACTLGVVDANGQLRIMRHRQDVVRFESRNPGGHTYWVAPAGGRTSLESALASGKATGFFGDDRTIAGHLPRDRAAFVVGKLASCQDQMSVLSATGGARRLAEDCFGLTAAGGKATKPVVRAVGALYNTHAVSYAAEATAFAAVASELLDPDSLAVLVSKMAEAESATRPIYRVAPAQLAVLRSDLAAVLARYPRARRLDLMVSLWEEAHAPDWSARLTAAFAAAHPAGGYGGDYDDYDYDYEDYAYDERDFAGGTQTWYETLAHRGLAAVLNVPGYSSFGVADMASPLELRWLHPRLVCATTLDELLPGAGQSWLTGTPLATSYAVENLEEFDDNGYRLSGGTNELAWQASSSDPGHTRAAAFSPDLPNASQARLAQSSDPATLLLLAARPGPLDPAAAVLLLENLARTSAARTEQDVFSLALVLLFLREDQDAAALQDHFQELGLESLGLNRNRLADSYDMTDLVSQASVIRDLEAPGQAPRPYQGNMYQSDQTLGVVAGLLPLERLRGVVATVPVPNPYGRNALPEALSLHPDVDSLDVGVLAASEQVGSTLASNPNLSPSTLMEFLCHPDSNRFEARACYASDNPQLANLSAAEKERLATRCLSSDAAEASTLLTSLLRHDRSDTTARVVTAALPTLEHLSTSLATALITRADTDTDTMGVLAASGVLDRLTARDLAPLCSRADLPERVVTKLANHHDVDVRTQLAQNESLLSGARPISPLVELVRGAAGAAVAGREFPTKPASWSALPGLPGDQTFAYTERIAKIQGVVLPESPALTIQLPQSAGDLAENARFMGNCTFSYRQGILSGQSVIGQVVDPAGVVQYNFHLRRESGSDRWGLGEINSRYNSRHIPTADIAALKTALSSSGIAVKNAYANNDDDPYGDYGYDDQFDVEPGADPHWWNWHPQRRPTPEEVLQLRWDTPDPMDVGASEELVRIGGSTVHVTRLDNWAEDLELAKNWR